MIESLKKLYGFDKADYKYVPAGGEILKLIGQEVVLVTYQKTDEVWDCKTEKAVIVSISDYNPINMTYKCKYVAQSNLDTEQEIRIIPEGYSWSDTGSDNYFVRFVPYSLHCKLVEDELFYERLKVLFDERDSLPFSIIKAISEGEKDKFLKYSGHIAAVIKLNDSDDVLYFRLFDIQVQHKAGKKYSVTIIDTNKKEYRIDVNSAEENKEYDFIGLGKVKFINLAD